MPGTPVIPEQPTPADRTDVGTTPIEAAPPPVPPAGGARGSARTLVSGTSWSAASQFVPLVINLGMTPYIIRGLGDARYGIFLLITTITMLLSQFDGGIGQAAMRFFTIYAGRDDRTATTRLLFSVSAVIAAFGVFITTAVVLFSERILQFFHLAPEYVPEARFLLVTLTAVVAVLLLRNLYNAVVSARNRFQVLSAAIIAGHVVYALGLWATIENGWGLYGVAGTMILQQVVGTLISVPVGVRFLTQQGLGFVTRAEAGEFFAYAWRIQIGGIAAILASQKDQLVAARIISAQQSGPFGQGTNFANQLRLVPLNALAPIQALVGAEVGAVGATGARPKIERLQRVWVVLVTGWCAVGVPSTYWGVKAWLPPGYAIAGDIASILLAGHFFGLVCIVDRTWALSLGHASIAMRQSVVSLLANVVASVALWFPFGLLGVVAGTAIGTMAGTLFMSWDVSRVVEVRIRWFLRQVPLWQAAAAAGLTLVLELLVAPWAPHGPLGLLTCGLLAGPGFVLLVMTTLGVRGAKDALALVRRR
ncbi:putative polysaccharide biosynthesis protein [Mobilicoccus pelagius NBRC 104925]|uniref:Putative polysaccharide biosynthesis protein n=1 Tax=Mobilicoccus pelagius NBRC 104925 TaxID=1089455 RepID=H5UMQ9_9MICO|nr:putative polysaccharide biosynthesis protein [Mobilicoccus pelagius NBRC 104925]